MKNVISAVTQILPFIPDILAYFKDNDSLSDEEFESFLVVVKRVQDDVGELSDVTWILISAYTNALLQKCIDVDTYQNLYNQRTEIKNGHK